MRIDDSHEDAAMISELTAAAWAQHPIADGLCLTYLNSDSEVIVVLFSEEIADAIRREREQFHTSRLLTIGISANDGLSMLLARYENTWSVVQVTEHGVTPADPESTSMFMAMLPEDPGT